MKKMFKKMTKTEVFCDFCVKKRQVSVAINELLFLATDTCLFFTENIHKHLTFFTFSTFLLKIANLIFEVWCQKNNCQVLMPTEFLVKTNKIYQLHFEKQNLPENIQIFKKSNQKNEKNVVKVKFFVIFVINKKSGKCQ